LRPRYQHRVDGAPILRLAINNQLPKDLQPSCALFLAASKKHFRMRTMPARIKNQLSFHQALLQRRHVISSAPRLVIVVFGAALSSRDRTDSGPERG
jgi:hypothetical protein